MTDLDQRLLKIAAFIVWLERENGYTNVKLLPDGRWAGLLRFLYTHAIIVGQIGDQCGYDDRWCFASEAKALAALNEWDGTGEPNGWHRHPGSGRRRPEGSVSEEY